MFIIINILVIISISIVIVFPILLLLLLLLLIVLSSLLLLLSITITITITIITVKIIITFNVIYLMVVKNNIFTFQNRSLGGVPKYILLKSMQNQQQQIEIASSYMLLDVYICLCYQLNFHKKLGFFMSISVDL